jgi:hypothetical protein
METGRSCKMSGENGKKCGEKQDANTSQLPRLDVTLIYISMAPSDITIQERTTVTSSGSDESFRRRYC